MEGLVKIAWTKRVLRKAHTTLDKLDQEAGESARLTKEDYKTIMNYLDQEKGLRPQTMIFTELGAPSEFGPPFGVEAINKLQKFKTKNIPNYKNSPMEDVYNLYNGSKDGLVLSEPSRSTFAHELGHAMDYKNNPLGYYSMGAGKLSRGISPALAATASATGTYLTARNEENPTSHNLITGAGLGAVAGGGLAGIGGALVMRGENAANRLGEEIINGSFKPDKAKEYIDQGRPLRDAALNTYKMNNLRLFKNSLIGASIGALGGLGLSSIKQNKEQIHS